MASDLISGDLADDLVADVTEHVAGCPSCPALYRSMVLVRERLREFSVGPDAATRDRLRRSWDEAEGPGA
jgi:hypothetical protein